LKNNKNKQESRH